MKRLLVDLGIGFAIVLSMAACAAKREYEFEKTTPDGTIVKARVQIPASDVGVDGFSIATPDGVAIEVQGYTAADRQADILAARVKLAEQIATITGHLADLLK